MGIKIKPIVWNGLNALTPLGEFSLVPRAANMDEYYVYYQPRGEMFSRPWNLASRKKKASKEVVEGEYKKQVKELLSYIEVE